MRTFADIAEHGGHWCRVCRHFVTAVVSHVGLPLRCPHCEGFKVKYVEPVPGYRRPVAAPAEKEAVA